MSEPDLKFVMEKDREGKFSLWACRGVGRGCTRNRYRTRKVHCDDCLACRNDETLEQVQARLSRGDA